MPATIHPTGPRIDRWRREQPAHVELAMRYAIRGKFLEHGGTLAHTARIDELFAMLNPSENESPRSCAAPERSAMLWSGNSARLNDFSKSLSTAIFN
jgi:hypothetical protein